MRKGLACPRGFSSEVNKLQSEALEQMQYQFANFVDDW